MENDILNSLNENQKKVVLENIFPLYVIAGAGTGKTRTLTAKVFYLINNLNISPNEILTLTFTTKAADEMKNRIKSYFENKNIDLKFDWILNFHKMAVKILKKNIEKLEIGFYNDFSIIEETDVNSFVSEIIKLKFSEEKYKENNKNKLLNEKKKISNAIYLYKVNKTIDFDIDINALLKSNNISSINQDDFLLIYNLYEEKLRINNSLFFDDLIIYTYLLLKENEDVRSYYENKFKYILVDEFQDTDFLNYEILKLLRKNNKNNIFVVGDPNQSIYSFRGACFENNKKFINDFGARTIKLDVNYRSPDPILKYANNLISYTSYFNDVVLKSGKDGYSPFIYNFFDDEREVDFIIKEIKKLINNEGYLLKDIAILYRSNYLSSKIEDKLIKSGIDYRVFGGISFYQRKEIKDIIAFLNLILGNIKPIYLDRVLNIPKRGLSEGSKLKIISILNDNINYSLMDIYEKVELTKNAKTNFLEFINLINEGKNYIENSSYSIIDFILEKIGYKNYLENEETDTYKERLENIKELKTLIIQNSKDINSKKEAILQTLENIAINNELLSNNKRKLNQDNKDFITVSTIHQVKGMEFKVVFVYGLNERILPVYSIDDEIEEEERRICYVAITRPMELLYLTFSNKRFKFGTVSDYGQSRFLLEMKKNKNHIKKDYKKIEHDDFEKISKTANYKIGDKVYIKTYGYGYVINVTNHIIEVSFESLLDTKKFLKDNNKLIKVDNT